MQPSPPEEPPSLAANTPAPAADAGPALPSRGGAIAGLAPLYPLSGLPRQGQIWSWISYDVANQSFTLLINTLLFNIYFTTVIAGGKPWAATAWSALFAGSMLLTVVASPILGAIADARAWRKAMLLVSGFACGVLTCLLGLTGPGDVLLAALIYIPANFFFNIGENFLASFLPDVSRRGDYGRVSGFSWGVAYTAALLLLIITGAAMWLLSLEAPDRWPPLLVFAGAWFIIVAIPTAVWLKEARPDSSPAAPTLGPVRDGIARLKQSVRNTRSYPDLIMLLAASLFYGAAMNVIIAFASILAKDFGFSDVALVGFVAVVTVSGIGGTLATTLVQDRVGHRLTTALLLLIWILTSLALLFYAQAAARLGPDATPTWPLWVLGNLIGFGLGSLGSANRAFVGVLTPAGRTGEVFGLWGMVFKLAAVLTIPFAIVKDVFGTPAAMAVLTVLLIIGLVLTLLVRERRGIQRAAEPA
jgi:UMF1 family MFS transporter